jgi:hypothetical protein
MHCLKNILWYIFTSSKTNYERSKGEFALQYVIVKEKHFWNFRAYMRLRTFTEGSAELSLQLYMNIRVVSSLTQSVTVCERLWVVVVKLVF